VGCKQHGVFISPLSFIKKGKEAKKSRERVDTCKSANGRAIAEAVSRWLPTAAAQVQSRVWSSGICGDKVAPGQVFSEYFGFLPFIPPNSPSSQSPGASTIGQ
jgi:hypothetical protein